MVTVPELLDGHTVLDVECLDRVYLNVILSFRVTRRCDVRRLVEDSVVNETVAAWSPVFQRC